MVFFFTLIQPIGQVENSKNVSCLFDLLDFNCYLQQREKEKKKWFTHTESSAYHSLINYMLRSESRRRNGYLLSFWSVSVFACLIHKQSISSVLRITTACYSNMEQKLAPLDFLRDPMSVFNMTASQGALRVLNIQGTFQGYSSFTLPMDFRNRSVLDAMLLYTGMSCLLDPLLSFQEQAHLGRNLW